MSVGVEFHKRDIDVVNLLGSAAVVGEYRGKEAWRAIEKQIEEEVDSTLVLIDIRGANPLQYEFCQYAFGPLFQALNSGRWKHKYVMFQMHDFHKPGFFRGILKRLGTELPRKESEKGFISAGFYTKLILGDGELITFVGKLNENQQRTLNVVNELKEATAKQAVERLALSEEIVVDALRFLVNNYFVVTVQGPPGAITYYSFYKYFLKE